MSRSLASAWRLVIMIGSALLVEQEAGTLKRAWLEALADDVAALKAEGVEVVLVSSGAIALGRRHLKLPPGALALEQKQAAAATGQIRLAHAWQEALARHSITCAQILVTLEDTEERRRHLNARATIATLLSLGAVPVINENDTVATSEIRFGDNDRLAARVAQMISADTLVLLSDIDGLYTADPRADRNATHIGEVGRITGEIEGMAGEAPAGYSSGGMVTKIAAAKIAQGAGCRMAIADGAKCTWFKPDLQPKTARKRWIAGSVKPIGWVKVDPGAARALGRGKSLLPAGIVEIGGRFERGDPIEVRDPDGAVLARGLSAYSAEDAKRIKGHKSGDIETILGYRGRDEMIHRDDLVLEQT